MDNMILQARLLEKQMGMQQPQQPQAQPTGGQATGTDTNNDGLDDGTGLPIKRVTTITEDINNKTGKVAQREQKTKITNPTAVYDAEQADNRLPSGVATNVVNGVTQKSNEMMINFYLNKGRDTPLEYFSKQVIEKYVVPDLRTSIEGDPKRKGADVPDPAVDVPNQGGGLLSRAKGWLTGSGTTKPAESPTFTGETQAENMARVATDAQLRDVNQIDARLGTITNPVPAATPDPVQYEPTKKTIQHWNNPQNERPPPPTQPAQPTPGSTATNPLQTVPEGYKGQVNYVDAEGNPALAPTPASPDHSTSPPPVGPTSDPAASSAYLPVGGGIRENLKNAAGHWLTGVLPESLGGAGRKLTGNMRTNMLAGQNKNLKLSPQQTQAERETYDTAQTSARRDNLMSSTVGYVNGTPQSTDDLDIWSFDEPLDEFWQLQKTMHEFREYDTTEAIRIAYV